MPTRPEEDRSSVPPSLEEDDGLVGWETVREAIVGQPETAPSSLVERALLAKIRVREAERLAPPPSWWTWAWGVAVALLVSVVLWAVLQPGIVLEWTAQTHAVTSFQVLRSSARSDEFWTLHTFDAAQTEQQYRYVDLYVWSGRTYVYRVEARADGRLVDERTLVVPGHVALPGQLAVLATGVLVGYGAVLLAHRGTIFARAGHGREHGPGGPKPGIASTR